MNIDPSDDCTFWYVNDIIRSLGRLPAQPVGKRESVASSCLVASSDNLDDNLQRTLVNMFGIAHSGRSQLLPPVFGLRPLRCD